MPGAMNDSVKCCSVGISDFTNSEKQESSLDSLCLENGSKAKALKELDIKIQVVQMGFSSDIQVLKHRLT